MIYVFILCPPTSASKYCAVSQTRLLLTINYTRFAHLLKAVLANRLGLQSLRFVILTPSLPQPVTFPGKKLHERACKQYMFRSYNICIYIYTFSAMRFDKKKILSHANAKKKTERLNGFKLYTLIGRFQVTSWQRRG